MAERFDIGFHALKLRMQIEGWTRCAVAEATDLAPPRRAAPGFGGTGRPRGRPPGSGKAATVALAGPPRGMTAAEVARWAVREAGQALVEGRPETALRAVRAADQLTRLLKLHPELDPERTLPKSELRALFRDDRSVIEELTEEYGLTPDQAATVAWEAFVRADGTLGARPPLASWLPGRRGRVEGNRRAGAHS